MGYMDEGGDIKKTVSRDSSPTLLLTESAWTDFFILHTIKYTVPNSLE